MSIVKYDIIIHMHGLTTLKIWECDLKIEKLWDRSLKIAKTMLDPDSEKWNYHFAFAYRGYHLLGIGVNNPIVPNNKAYKIGKQFNVSHFIQYPYLHAETDLVWRLGYKNAKIWKKLIIICIRLSKNGQTMKSRPCPNCQTVLDLLNCENVFWSLSGGKLECFGKL